MNRAPQSPTKAPSKPPDASLARKRPRKCLRNSRSRHVCLQRQTQRQPRATPMGMGAPKRHERPRHELR